MVIQVISRNQTLGSDPIRPFSLRRDLRALADLLETSFKQELIATGNPMVEDMRQIAEWGPLLHLMHLAIPMEGYVWVENGRLLGNVTLTRENDNRWVLSNVAVAVDARGQGIAGKLIDTAIEHVRQRGGKVITLEVRADNAIAEALYAHRGFVVYDTVHDLRLSAVCWPVILHQVHPMVRPPRHQEADVLYDVLLTSLPEKARSFQCLDPLLWRQDLWAHLQRAWEVIAKGTSRTVLVAAPNEEPVGMIAALIRLFGTFYELQIHIKPEARGLVEAPLLEGLFSQLNGFPRRDIRAQISIDYEQALERMHQLGFRTIRVLKRMGQFL